MTGYGGCRCCGDGVIGRAAEQRPGALTVRGESERVVRPAPAETLEADEPGHGARHGCGVPPENLCCNVLHRDLSLVQR